MTVAVQARPAGQLVLPLDLDDRTPEEVRRDRRRLAELFEPADLVADPADW